MMLSVKTVQFHLTRIYTKLASGPAPSWRPARCDRRTTVEWSAVWSG